jgi:hypothetical protein
MRFWQGGLQSKQHPNRVLKKLVAFPTPFAFVRVLFKTLHKCNIKEGC